MSPSQDPATASDPLAVDLAVRAAVQACWRSLPEAERTPARVAREMRRLLQRALADLERNAAAFGFAGADDATTAAQRAKEARIAEARARHPSAYTPWSPEDDAALRARAAQGATVAAMAKEFHRSRGAIKARLKALGIEPSPRTPTSSDGATRPSQ